jgi:hypothetical protein
MPRYDFKCKCGFVEELFMSVKLLKKTVVECEKCGAAMHNDVAANARTQNPKTQKPYYSEQLDAEVTGRMQFDELCKRRDVTPVPQGITKELPGHMKQRSDADKELISQGLKGRKFGVDSEAC